jgi:hypothetical protein
MSSQKEARFFTIGQIFKGLSLWLIDFKNLTATIIGKVWGSEN